MNSLPTREILLEIGLNLFSSQTYEGVSVADIVSQAKVTKPTLYHHFGSKFGFYRAVFEHYGTPFLEMLKEKATFNHDFVHHLNELTRCSLEFFMADARVFWLLEYASHVSTDAEHHAFVQAFWHEVTKSLNVLFEEAVVQHGNLRDKTKLSAWLFLHAVRAQVHLVLRNRDAYSPELPYRLVHQFMYGLFA